MGISPILVGRSLPARIFWTISKVSLSMIASWAVSYTHLSDQSVIAGDTARDQQKEHENEGDDLRQPERPALRFQLDQAISLIQLFHLVLPCHPPRQTPHHRADSEHE